MDFDFKWLLIIGLIVGMVVGIAAWETLCWLTNHISFAWVSP